MKKIILTIAFLTLFSASQVFAQDKIDCSGGNETYPGIQSGEIFITTTSKKNFKNFFWKTKRLGKVAYSCESGKRLKGQFPIFVAKEEWQAHAPLRETTKTLIWYLFFKNRKPDKGPTTLPGRPF